MKSKTLIIFGIITYILSVLSSAQNLEGDYTAPTIIIAVSLIATIVFTIMAVVHLWKTEKVSSILLLVFSSLNLVLASVVIHWISFGMFLWVMSLFWAMAKHEKLVKINIQNI